VAEDGEEQTEVIDKIFLEESNFFGYNKITFPIFSDLTTLNI
jgi:hypothetical protein